jgi:hypothetical protein
MSMRTFGQNPPAHETPSGPGLGRYLSPEMMIGPATPWFVKFVLSMRNWTRTLPVPQPQGSTFSELPAVLA